MNIGAKATLIISVYKNIAFLRVVLDSLKHQTEQAFELIISEDGQDEAMRTFIQNYPFSQPFLHLTQPDIGWNKCAALNNAVRKANADWLIFIDEDCVLHPRFVEMHLRYARPDRMLMGKRVKLNAALSEILMGDVCASSKVERALFKMLLTGKKQGTKAVEEGFFVNPDGLLGFLPPLRKKRRLIGSNMSFAKSALMRINGFDESYRKPTVGEDTDLKWRLEAIGVEPFSVCWLAVQYHLYHPESWDEETNRANKSVMFANMEQGLFFCKDGMEKEQSLPKKQVR